MGLSDESPSFTEFLRTLDWIVTPYKADATRLVSADGEVVFEKAAELPPVEYPWRMAADTPDEYAMLLFRLDRQIEANTERQGMDAANADHPRPSLHSDRSASGDSSGR